MIVEEPGVVRIREDERHDLVLLISHADLTAVGARGVVWTSERFVFDDLKVVAIDDRGIVCTGYEDHELPSEFIVDPATGKARRLE